MHTHICIPMIDLFRICYSSINILIAISCFHLSSFSIFILIFNLSFLPPLSLSAAFSFLVTPLSPVIGWYDALNSDKTINTSPVRTELERAESYKIPVGFLKGSGATIKATVETIPGTAGIHMYIHISGTGTGRGIREPGTAHIFHKLKYTSYVDTQ